jgi:hypothetical protein
VAHARHLQVRARFGGRCGYCGVSDEDVGGELTVDHYVPVVAGGDDGDDNLVYACFRYNLFKADFHPTDADRARGQFLLYPLRDQLQQHVRLEQSTGLLEHITETGRFHILLLHLNRPALIAYRLRQHHAELVAARNAMLEAEIRELLTIIQTQERYMAGVIRLLEGHSGEQSGKP